MCTFIPQRHPHFPRRVVIAAGVGPLLLLQPVALAIPSSWEFQNRIIFLTLFSIEAPVYVGVAVLALLCSYGAGAALRSSRALLSQLRMQAARMQGLLEAAMPPVIARALLDDIPAADLTRSFEFATIAFVSLEDYEAKTSGDPVALVAWLDAVYVAFDALVDAYGERVNKIEIVSVSISAADLQA
jgi:hypothetical protein